jgi:sugar lactone lactonase YvrE
MRLAFRALPFLFASLAAFGASTPMVRTISGDGTAGFAAGSTTRWNYPFGATSDMLGNIYVADTENQVIRVIHADGTVAIVAGRAGSAGSEDGAANVARFNTPRGIVAGFNGELYVADSGNHVIRRIDSTGKVSTFAGVAGLPGSANGFPSEARFNFPSGLAIDWSGTLYVTDTANHLIRYVTADGRVRTLAGKARLAGNADGFADTARFSFPWGITLLPSGELLVTDQGNQTVRSVSASGAVRTLYGSPGARGYVDGEGGAVRFSTPSGISSDSAGNAFVADADNNVIRAIVQGRVYTYAGTSHPCFVDGPAPSSCFDHPMGVAVVGNRLIVLDTHNQAVRLVETPLGRRRGVRR